MADSLSGSEPIEAARPMCSPPLDASCSTQKRVLHPPSWLPQLALAVVVVTAVGLGWNLYARFLGDCRHLWYDTHHDRNAHYLFALKLAEDLQHGKLVTLLRDLDSARVWPPLHGILLAPLLASSGFDYRLAVFPSLVGWVGTAIMGFLLARRAVPRSGNVAGLTATLFILASPAYRAFATDVMLESLGAFLTLTVLYFYIVCVQDGWPRAGCALGLSLTALFLHKYNYLVLVVVALVVSEFCVRPGAYGRFLLGVLARVEWRDWSVRQLRSPLNYVLAGVLGFMAVVLLTGTKSITLFGHIVRVHPPTNLVTVAYAIFFIRLVGWWRSAGRLWSETIDQRFRDLINWHLWPVAVIFLIPKRLGIFLWYVSPANFNGEVRPTLAQSASFYGNIALTDYHLGLASAVLAVVLLAVALLAVIGRWLRPGGHAIVCLFLLGTWLTVSHPCQQGRYLHSWFAAGWVVAGIGLARALQLRFLVNRAFVQGTLALAVLASLTLLHAPALIAGGHALEGGLERSRASILDVTDSYLDALDGPEPVTVFANVPFRFLSEWTYVERYGGHARLDSHWFGFGKPGTDNRQGFQRWLQTTRCATLVFVDRLPGAAFCENCDREPECVYCAEIRDLLGYQTVFHPIKRTDFPEHGVSVTVWRRTHSLMSGSGEW
jgi:hypothetical protein